jgi:hypothetical protein
MLSKYYKFKRIVNYSIMKNLKLFALVIFSILFISVSSCSNNQDILSNKSEINLTSPSGFRIGSNIADFKKSNNLNVNSKILDINYIEGENGNIALISYEFEGKNLNFAIAAGEYSLDANSLILNDNFKKSGEDGDTRINCEGEDGCSPCRVQAEKDKDGTLHIMCQCECCAMILSEETEE